MTNMGISGSSARPARCHFSGIGRRQHFPIDSGACFRYEIVPAEKRLLRGIPGTGPPERGGGPALTFEQKMGAWNRIAAILNTQRRHSDLCPGTRRLNAGGSWTDAGGEEKKG